MKLVLLGTQTRKRKTGPLVPDRILSSKVMGNEGLLFSDGTQRDIADAVSRVKAAKEAVRKNRLGIFWDSYTQYNVLQPNLKILLGALAKLRPNIELNRNSINTTDRKAAKDTLELLSMAERIKEESPTISTRPNQQITRNETRVTTNYTTRVLKFE